MNTTTVDLANEKSISAYYGKKAVWTSYEGSRRIGTLTADPRGGAWPVTTFEDGTHGRNGSVIELVEDGARATVQGGHGTGYVMSTTGTAPLAITPTEPGLVRIDLEDGSSQVYRVADLLAALGEDR